MLGRHLNFLTHRTAARVRRAAATPLLAALSNAPTLRYMHRAASLEDVFIKLTGRELRD